MIEGRNCKYCIYRLVCNGECFIDDYFRGNKPTRKMITCSNCGEKSTFKEWFDNKYHCPKCGKWWWSVNVIV